MVTVDLPDGFNKPEGVKEEEPFTVSATVYIKGDTLCIEQINGFEVGDEVEEQDEETGFMKTYNSERGNY